MADELPSCIHGKSIEVPCRRCEYIQAKAERYAMPEYTDPNAPAKSKTSATTPNRGFRAPDELWDPAMRIAKFHDTSITAVLCRALEDYIADNADALHAMGVASHTFDVVPEAVEA
jgi:hypothetical protein